MGTKLEPRDEELYRRVDEVLHYVWDPIGVAGSPRARDEYYSYLPQVFSMLKSGSTERELAERLQRIAIERMKLTFGEERALTAASTLVQWKEAIDEKYA